MFAHAFPEEKIAISAKTIGKALATFERTIVSDIAPFDRWIAGDEYAISDAAKRGFLVFNGKGDCVKCHTGWRLTNGMFADTGLPSSDLGKGKLTSNVWLAHSFKTPTLRNIDRRGPYMHDGSLATLSEVIGHYDAGGTVKRKTSALFLKPLHLSQSEKNDLLQFLHTLTSEDEAVAMPSLPKGEWEGGIWTKQITTK
jgi:cytochrome c peroxidase